MADEELSQSTITLQPPTTGALRATLQKLLLDQVIHSVPVAESAWKALVVDRAALRILASTLYLNDLVNEGVSIIELIDIRRAPLPSVPAVYFLTPCAETVEYLANEPLSQYKSYRIFFTSPLSRFFLNTIKNRAKFITRVKQFVDLNVPFLALESRVFSLDRPASSLPQIHATDIPAEKVREELGEIRDRLSEVCRLLAPHLSWTVRSDATSFTTRTLASLLREELDVSSSRGLASACAPTSGRFPPGVTPPSNATLLIIDRASDLASPLIHEFSYQAMAHDLLSLNYRKPGGAHIEVDDEKTQGKKFVQLDDEDRDPVWSSIRWMFIQDALNGAQDAFREFVQNDAAFKIRGKTADQLDIKDMSAAVRALPQSQMKADKHALHITATRACLEACKQLSLTDLALVEQNLILGRASDGTKIKAEVMVENILTALSDERIPLNHRLRLLMLALVVSEGLPGLGGENSALSSSSSFRSRLMRADIMTALSLNAEMSASVEGLERMLRTAKEGVTRIQNRINPHLAGGDGMAAKLWQRYAARQSAKQAKRERAARRKRHGLDSEEELQYDVARYSPPLRSVMMDLVDNKLDEMFFPSADTLSIDAIISSMGNSALDEPEKEERTSSSRGHRVKYKLNHMLRRHDRDKKSDDDDDDSDSSDEETHQLSDPDHLYVIFVLGGISYSEVRAMYEVCSKRSANVIIGGSEVLTPNMFVRNLAAVADSVIRVQAMLPPLPLELAVRKAPMKKSAAHSVDGAEEDGNAGLTVGSIDDEFQYDRQNGGAVEVVTGYKKNRGLRIFGRKKK